MRKALTGLFALALAVAAAPAMAQEPVDQPSTTARVPNFLGASGLLLAPSAYTQNAGNWSAYFYATDPFIGGGAQVGIGDQFEVSGTILDLDPGDVEFLGNAKFNFLTETRDRPALAIGVIDVFDQLDVDPSWYIVASKYFTRTEIEQRFALKGHLGFGGGIYDENIFAGAELFFSPNLSAMAEWVDNDINLGGRWTSRGLSITLALFDFDDFGGGISYTARFR